MLLEGFEVLEMKWGSKAPRIPGLTCLIYFTMVSPFVTLLTDVETNFCGGNKAFKILQDP